MVGARRSIVHQTGRATAGEAATTPPQRLPRSLPPPIGDREGAAGVSRSGATTVRAIEILSHELRSPITTIRLGARVLGDDRITMSAQARTEVIAAIEAEIERLSRLVEDLLAVARDEADTPPLPVRPLMLQRWLPGMLATQERASPALRVRSMVPADAPPVMADDAALAQVMGNLLANVVRHAPAGLPAEIAAGAPERGMLPIEVLDRGPGIDPADAERVFEPFYRAPSAEARGSGAGLGLTAARRLVDAMGGTIAALPRAGGGTRMVVGLPVATGDADGDADAESDPPGGGELYGSDSAG
jgi:two-component system sensor histidine kinase KdpD